MSYEDYDPRRSLHRVLEFAELLRQDGKLSVIGAQWGTAAAAVHAVTYIGDQVGRLADAMQRKEAAHGPWPRAWAVNDLVWHSPPDEPPHALVTLDRRDPEAPGWWLGRVLYVRGVLARSGPVLGPGDVVRLEEAREWNHRLELGD